MDKINKDILKKILCSIVNEINQDEEYLTQLDASTGDGDLGITMAKGFKSIYEEIDNIDSDDMGIIFMKLGMKMNETVPSTMGTLLSICLLKSAKEVKGLNEIGIAEIAEMCKSAVTGVCERGKVKVGERTMVDALYPASESLIKSSKEKVTLKEAFESAFKAAECGAEETKKLKPVHGRAAYYADKIIGKSDSGAVAVMSIFNGIKKSFE